MGSLDEAVVRRLALVLRVGVAAALVLIVPGLLLASAKGLPGFTPFPDLGDLLAGVAAGQPVALVALGVLVMFVLPPLQALVAFQGFLATGHRRLALAALGVLLVQAVAVAVAWL